MRASKRRDKPAPCPHCGSEQVIPIVYGMPGAELGAAWERGEVELGGCVVSGNDPERHCRECWTQWNDRMVWPGPPPEEQARLKTAGLGVGWWEAKAVARDHSKSE